MLAGWALLRRVLAEGTEELSLRLPEQCPLAVENPPYSVHRLIEWLEERVRERERQFNDRNGNTYFSQIVNYRLKQVGDNTPTSE